MSDQLELEPWYSSEAAKRALGRLCQAVNEQGEAIRLLGTPTAPLLLLVDADEHPEKAGDITITIDEAKADWPAVTLAAAIYGTRFRLQGKRVMRAVLFKHPGAHHPAERYRRSNSPDANRLAEQLDALAKEVRKLGQKLARASFSAVSQIRRVNSFDRNVPRDRRAHDGRRLQGQPHESKTALAGNRELAWTRGNTKWLDVVDEGAA